VAMLGPVPPDTYQTQGASSPRTLAVRGEYGRRQQRTDQFCNKVGYATLPLSSKPGYNEYR
jgi:hypothetical protein